MNTFLISLATIFGQGSMSTMSHPDWDVNDSGRLSSHTAKKRPVCRTFARPFMKWFNDASHMLEIARPLCFLVHLYYTVCDPCHFKGLIERRTKLPHARTEIWMLGWLKLKTQAIWRSICSMLKHVTIRHHITATNAITCANCAGKIHSFVALESVRSSRRGSPNPRAAPQVSGANFVPHMTWTTWIPNKGMV